VKYGEWKDGKRLRWVEKDELPEDLVAED